MPAYRDEKTGKYFASFYFTDYTGAKKKKMKRGFARKRDAQEWERQFLMQQSANLGMTFGDFVEIYRRDKQDRLRESTWISKNNMIDTKILPYFKDRVISEIEPHDVIAWQNDIMTLRKDDGAPYSPSYLRSVHSQLSAIFNHAKKYYRLKENPAETVGNMGREQHREMLFWTKEEYRMFSAAVMDKPLYYYAFEVLYWTGIREGELLALTAADFDLKRNVLHITKSLQRLHGRDVVTEPKTPKSIRTIQIPPFLADEMQDFISTLYGLNPTDRLFPLTKNQLAREMSRCSKAAGVKKIRIHDLRHPYVKLKTKLFSPSSQRSIFYFLPPNDHYRYIASIKNGQPVNLDCPLDNPCSLFLRIPRQCS